MLKKKTKETAKKEQSNPQADLLIEQLEKYFGVEYSGDDEKFIEELSKASRDVLDNPNKSVNQIEHAKHTGRIGELRDILLFKDEGTDHANIREAIKDYPVAITFLDNGTWLMKGSAGEDSGSSDMPLSAIT